jgi:hypothetical protein
MNLKRLLIFHAVITLAAGVTLVIAPGLIPSLVGIHFNKDAYFLSYLLAGAEFAIAFLSYRGTTVKNSRALYLLVQTFIVFHATTALLELYALIQGFDARIWFNVAGRALIVGLFWYYGFVKSNSTYSD